MAEADRLLAPPGDCMGQLFVAVVVDLEFLPSEPLEPAEHVGEHSRGESPVLLCREPAQPLEAVAGLDRQQVDEVASFGASGTR